MQTITKPRTRPATTPSRQQAIEARLREMPDSYRRTYERAISGKSKSAAVKAFCQECTCWQREEIKLCTDTGCPLWLYPPYQRS